MVNDLQHGRPAAHRERTEKRNSVLTIDYCINAPTMGRKPNQGAEVDAERPAEPDNRETAAVTSPRKTFWTGGHYRHPSTRGGQPFSDALGEDFRTTRLRMIQVPPVQDHDMAISPGLVHLRCTRRRSMLLESSMSNTVEACCKSRSLLIGC
jgi:hypothetical protein